MLYVHVGPVNVFWQRSSNMDLATVLPNPFVSWKLLYVYFGIAAVACDIRPRGLQLCRERRYHPSEPFPCIRAEQIQTDPHDMSQTPFVSNRPRVRRFLIDRSYCTYGHVRIDCLPDKARTKTKYSSMRHTKPRFMYPRSD